jgi:hypothetical protein
VGVLYCTKHAAQWRTPTPPASRQRCCQCTVQLRQLCLLAMRTQPLRDACTHTLTKARSQTNRRSHERTAGHLLGVGW